MATAGAPTPIPPPLEGELHDVGATRRESVRTARYTATGELKVLGDVVVTSAAFQGLAVVGGRLEAAHLRSEGRLEVAGPVVARGEATLAGTLRLTGGLETGDLALSGEVEVRGPIAANGEIRLRGHLAAPGPVTARGVHIDGSVDVPGAIDSPFVLIRLRRPSRIGRIRSENARVVVPPFVARGTRLTVDRIEATDVALAHVDCEYLRAERIRLGPLARVTRLDGTVVQRHRTAWVGPFAESDHPYGLTR
ncbi:MAG TPA: hypothetical protein VMH78_03800 [Thermoplasmata archaeon]|nr:hypothetical protein [Thermoplasmata archaeon]